MTPRVPPRQLTSAQRAALHARTDMEASTRSALAYLTGEHAASPEPQQQRVAASTSTPHAQGDVSAQIENVQPTPAQRRRTNASNRAQVGGLQAVATPPSPVAPSPARERGVPGSEASRPVSIAETWAPDIARIFKNKAPVLKHIPIRARAAVLRSFTTCVWAPVQAANDERRAQAYIRLFMFARCILLALPKKKTRNAQRSNVQEILHRVRMWDQGDTQALWSAVEAKEKSHKLTRRTERPQHEQNAERAIRLAHEGALGKAANALQSNGIHAATSAVQQKLLEKHPQVVPHTEHDNAAPVPTQQHRALLEKAEPADIILCIKRFPRASAGGGTGLTPAHIKELARMPEANDVTGLVPALAQLVTLMAKGHVPARVSPWFLGAPLTPLRKRDGGVRPIAVGETLRRLVASWLMHKVSAKAAALLQPHQVGVATKSGAEAAVHAVRAMADELGTRSEFGLLQIDWQNAFNLVSRSAFLHQVDVHLPELAPWAHLCYGPGRHAHLWTSRFQLASVRGVQQGDPLGPLLFALALHPVIAELRKCIDHWQREADAVSTTDDRSLLLGFYIDDGFIVARHHVLQRAHAYLDGQCARAAGLQLGSKCELWWPTQPPPAERARYSTRIRINATGGTSLLGAHIGTHEHTRAQFTSAVRTLAPLMQRLGELRDAHVAFSLLRACFGVCRVNYALRATPADSTDEGAHIFDDLTAGALRRLSMAPITDEALAEMRLPVKLDSLDEPHFGIGLTSATDVAPAAYLASVCATRAIASRLKLDGAWRSLSDNTHVLHAHESLRRQAARAKNFSPTSMPTVAEMAEMAEMGDAHADSTPTQAQLTQLVHAGRRAQIPAGCARTAAFRASLALPGAKDWLRCMPMPAHGTHIRDRYFRAWLAFFARAHTRPQHVTACPRPKCRTPLDAHGDHLAHCACSAVGEFSPIIRRHDALVRAIAEAQCNAGRRAKVEPHSATRGAQSRPDILATNERGEVDVLDVAVTHSFRKSECARKPPQVVLNAAHGSKLHQHRAYAAAHDATIVPMVFAVSGAWHFASHAYMARIVHDIAARSDQPLSMVRARTFQRIAATLVTGNARALLAGISTPLW